MLEIEVLTRIGVLNIGGLSLGIEYIFTDFIYKHSHPCNYVSLITDKLSTTTLYLELHWGAWVNSFYREKQGHIYEAIIMPSNANQCGSRDTQPGI